MKARNYALQDLLEKHRIEDCYNKTIEEITNEALITKKTYYEVLDDGISSRKSTLLRLAVVLKLSNNEIMDLLWFKGYTIGHGNRDRYLTDYLSSTLPEDRKVEDIVQIFKIRGSKSSEFKKTLERYRKTVHYYCNSTNALCYSAELTKKAYYSSLIDSNNVTKETLLRIAFVFEVSDIDINRMLFFHGLVFGSGERDQRILEYLNNTSISDRDYESLNELLIKSGCRPI